ncbi:MAG: hypothetical protein JWO45_880 [Spartobacteria bacterium]|nr:hypothetical protein [Spartobacteria bacterium]
MFARDVFRRSLQGMNFGVHGENIRVEAPGSSLSMRRLRPQVRLTRRSLVTLLFIAFLGLALPAHAEPERNMSALEIFDAALAKFEADRVALHQWQYHQTLTTHQFDHDGKVVAKGTWHSIVRPGDPGPLEYTGKSVEGKLSFFETGAAEEKPASAKSGTSPPATQPSAKTKENQTEWVVETVRKYNLRNRYDWKQLPDSTASGEEAYVLAFKPKSKQSASTREERFFGRLAGRIWVSKHDFTVLRADGALQSSASLFWIIARVTTFRFTYRLEPPHEANRLLRLSRSTATTVVAFPFYKVRQKHWQSVDNYEPRTPRGGAER